MKDSSFDSTGEDLGPEPNLILSFDLLLVEEKEKAVYIKEKPDRNLALPYT